VGSLQFSGTSEPGTPLRWSIVGRG